MNVMRAGAFVRRSGADGLGHVGWSYQYADGSFCDGAVENPGGTPVSPPGQTGFWCERVSDPITPMQLEKYDAFKMFDVSSSDPDDADRTVAWVGEQPYLVVFRNCMDDTYDVLRSYGVPELPLPFLEITPNDWFDALKATSQPVTTSALLAAGLLPRTSMPRQREMPKATPGAPRWRITGTAEWQEFHRELLKPSMARLSR